MNIHKLTNSHIKGVVLEEVDKNDSIAGTELSISERVELPSESEIAKRKETARELTQSIAKWQETKEKIVFGFLLLSSLVPIVTTIGIILSLLIETIAFFKEVSIIEFVTSTQWTPLFIPKHFGIAPLLAGTLLITFLGILIAIPIGLGAAVYLSEYASERARKILKPFLEILAGIPTVVYGYIALLFFTPLLRMIFPDMNIFNALSASIAVGIMVLPMIASLSEDAIYAVPRSLREGAYALGANKHEVIGRIVLPSAKSGIIASFILAISRAVGETMIVALAAGSTPNLTLNPLESVQTITAYIVQVSLGDTPYGSLEYKTIFAAGSVLFLLTFAINMLARKFIVGRGRIING